MVEKIPPPLEPPRFRLRTLLIVMTLVCVFLAITSKWSAYGLFAAVMLVLAILAHVLATVLGHRLRDHAARAAKTESLRPASERYRPVEASQFAPTTRLGHRRGPGRLIFVMTIIWTVVGAAGGATMLWIVNGERANYVNIGSGAAAFAVLGAIWGFVLASFVKEMWSAWWEAQKHK